MHGLIRVRQFTISEGHLVLRPDQLEEEFKGCLALAKYCLGTVGLLDKCTFRFSQWDPSNPHNKYEGTAEQWEHAQSTMAKILDDLDVHYSIGIDEAGGLIVRYPDGTEGVVSSGEVSVRGMYGYV